MNKKLLIAVLCLGVITLAACGSDNVSANNVSVNAVSEVSGVASDDDKAKQTESDDLADTSQGESDEAEQAQEEKKLEKDLHVTDYSEIANCVDHSAIRNIVVGGMDLSDSDLFFTDFKSMFSTIYLFSKHCRTMELAGTELERNFTKDDMVIVLFDNYVIGEPVKLTLTYNGFHIDVEIKMSSDESLYKTADNGMLLPGRITAYEGCTISIVSEIEDLQNVYVETVNGNWYINDSITFESKFN